jgi:hypothetical protein
MKFRFDGKQLSIARGVYKRNVKGDKAKFIKILMVNGYRGDTSQAWKDYLSL